MPRFLLTLSLFALISAPAAFAAAGDPGSWELGSDLGLAVNLRFHVDTTTNLQVGQHSVFTEVGYNLGNGLEIVLAPNYEHDFESSDEGSFDELSLRGGINYSFMPDVKNSIFGEVMIGLLWTSAQDEGSATAFTAALGLGKRFALSDWATYRPEILYAWDAGDFGQGGTGFLNIMPVAFSFYF